jgi:hypothetical protein
MFTFFVKCKNICPEKLKSFDGWLGRFLVETLPTSDVMSE